MLRCNPGSSFVGFCPRDSLQASCPCSMTVKKFRRAVGETLIRPPFKSARDDLGTQTDTPADLDATVERKAMTGSGVADDSATQGDLAGGIIYKTCCTVRMLSASASVGAYAVVIKVPSLALGRACDSTSVLK